MYLLMGDTGDFDLEEVRREIADRSPVSETLFKAIIKFLFSLNCVDLQAFSGVMCHCWPRYFSLFIDLLNCCRARALPINE